MHRIGHRVEESNQTRCMECPVRRLALFKAIPRELLDWTQGYREAQYDVEAGEEIIRQGEISSYCYTLYSGWLKIFKIHSNGAMQVVRFALPGDFIGFQANLTGPMEYSATAMGPVRVCAFPRSNLSAMLERHGELAARLAVINSQYMSLCQHHLVGARHKNARERLAFLLMEIWHRAEELGLCAAPDRPLSLPLSQRDIGDALGMAHETVCRNVKRLVAENCIAWERGRLLVKDAPALAEMGDFDPAIFSHSFF